jgi:hypothetical protein
MDGRSKGISSLFCRKGTIAVNLFRVIANRVLILDLNSTSISTNARRTQSFTKKELDLIRYSLSILSNFARGRREIVKIFKKEPRLRCKDRCTWKSL